MLRFNVRSIAKRIVPPTLYRSIAKRRYRLDPSPLDPWRRLTPDAPDNNARGIAVDRFYIEQFLETNRAAVTGNVLEIADDTYTKKFGSAIAVSDVLTDVRSGAQTSIIGDLRETATLQRDKYDCIILTQTLQFIDRPLAALATLHSGLKPGGVLLITVPGIAQRDGYDDGLWGDFYRWMPRGFRQLMSESNFRSYDVRGSGNVLTATAFLNNLAIEDLRASELSFNDGDYPLIVTCVATKDAALA